MKIAFFTDTYHPEVNGVVTYLDMITQELAKHGHHITIYTQSRAENLIKHPNVKIVKLPVLPIYPKFYLVMPLPKKLQKILQTEHADIIHVHTPGILALLALRIARKQGIPAVMSFHGFWHVYDKVFWPVRKLKRIRSIGISSSFGLKLGNDPVQQAIWLLLRTIYNRFDVVIAPSPSAAKVIRKKGIPCEAINYGIKYDVKPKKGVRLNRSILVVSRLSFEKDIQVVVDAFSLLAQKHPELRLTIVGDGPARKSLESLSTKLGISKKVTFTGMIKRDVLKNYYKSHGIFATGSTYELFGYTTAEAMSAGLPIVGVKAQGTEDLVKNGVNGFLVKPYDVKGFAEAIERVLDDRAMAKKMGNASMKLIKEYSAEKCGENHLRLYTRFIKKRRLLKHKSRRVSFNRQLQHIK
jgi:1,2-diacylglycerol 3-alpha-glucosyltransferase